MKEIDPTQSTDPRVRRATFVGATAAAAAGTAVLGTAFAQSDLGQSHPPIVAENDPAIVVEHVELQTPDGAIPAYAAAPKGATATTPCVVVVMAIWGVDVSIRDVVRRFAKAGFAAIAPDLYGRLGAPSGDGVSDISIFRPLAQKLQRPQAAADIKTAAQWLKARHSNARIGVTGFCMGGTIALRQAIDNASVFSADAVWYGNVADIDPAAIHMPIVGNYGERDTGIPAADVRAFQAKLQVPNDIVIYPEAGHAFFDDQRRSYVASAAEDAWRRTLAFFTKYLKA